MDRLLPAAVCSQSRIDVLCEHVSVHLQIADDICTPPAIAAAEEAEVEHAAAARMSDGVDLVEFDGDQSCEEGLVGIVDDAAALHDVCRFFEESLGCPANIVRVRAVVCVKDASVVCWHGVD